LLAIAQAKPHLTDRVVSSLLRVGAGDYRSSDCRHIAIGKALNALTVIHAHSRLKGEIDRYAHSHQSNSSKAARARAEKLIQCVAG